MTNTYGFASFNGSCINGEYEEQIDVTIEIETTQLQDETFNKEMDKLEILILDKISNLIKELKVREITNKF